MTRHDMTRHDMTRHDMTRQDKKNVIDEKKRGEVRKKKKMKK